MVVSNYLPVSDLSILKEEEEDISSLDTFETVLRAAITQDYQALNPLLLKKLYILFVSLSREGSISKCSDCLGIEIKKFNYTVKFSDIFNVSAFFFGELSRRFNLTTPLVKSSLQTESWGDQEDLILLLRCCMASLQLLEVKPRLLLEKCRDLAIILRLLCSPDLSFEQSDSPVPFICLVLEVFADELLVHKQLRQYFMMVGNNDVSFKNEKLFTHHLSDGRDSDVVLEVISAQFILSVHDEYVWKNFQVPSVSRPSQKFPCPELSLTAAMQLLGTPVVVSAPLSFQAYLISMVSRCIGIDRASGDPEVHTILKIHFITAFEKSFILYAGRLSCLKLCDHPRVNSGSTSCDELLISGSADCPSLENYICPVKYDPINQVAKSADYCPSLSFRTKSELLSACDAYSKENEHILNVFYKDEILSVLNSVVSQALVSKVEEGIDLHISGDISQQDVFLLASIVNLMSTSLLQVIRCTHGGNLGCQKNMIDQSCCEDYDFIIGVISSLSQYSGSHSIQNLLEDVMGYNLTSRKESKLGIMHFAGFLPFCYDRGHECLWKACIFMMMALMNLIILEDGNLEVFKALLCRRKESLPSHSATKSSKVSGGQSSSSKIALNFKRFQKLHLRGDNAMEDNTCSGASYLKLLNFQQDDIDDLADYLECKKEKDYYPKWVKNRKNYRKWKREKETTVKQRKKRETAQNKKGRKITGKVLKVC